MARRCRLEASSRDSGLPDEIPSVQRQKIQGRIGAVVGLRIVRFSPEAPGHRLEGTALPADEVADAVGVRIAFPLAQVEVGSWIRKEVDAFRVARQMASFENLEATTVVLLVNVQAASGCVESGLGAAATEERSRHGDSRKIDLHGDGWMVVESSSRCCFAVEILWSLDRNCEPTTWLCGVRFTPRKERKKGKIPQGMMIWYAGKG